VVKNPAVYLTTFINQVMYQSGTPVPALEPFCDLSAAYLARSSKLFMGEYFTNLL
jgi:hypothetical protein